MLIKIAEKLKPFCHLPGSSSILPGSSYQLRIFPTLLQVYDLACSEPQLKLEINFDIIGPLKEFTIQNDLEKGEIRVWGKTSLGFLRYRLNAYQNGQDIRLQIDKAPQDMLRVFNQNQSWTLKPKEFYTLFQLDNNSNEEIFCPKKNEKLSLGSHKSQDWELVKRRQDLTEIFPIWHRLGQLVKLASNQSNLSEGTLELLDRCQQAMDQNRPEKLALLWAELFLVGFKSLLVPCLQDNFHQGILVNRSKITPHTSALTLLSQGSKLIRELFLQCHQSQLKLLPSLLPEFHCGRLLAVEVPAGIFSMEWTKKRIRRCELLVSSQQTSEVSLNFRHFKKCRMKKGHVDKGQVIVADQPLILEKNSHYFFDNFS